MPNSFPDLPPSQQTPRQKYGPVVLPFRRRQVVPTETSQKAQAMIKPIAATQRLAVYQFIASRGNEGATDQEIQEGLGISGNSENPRRGELAKEPFCWIVKLPPSRCRKTRSGRWADVWVTAEIARRVFGIPSYHFPA